MTNCRPVRRTFIAQIISAISYLKHTYWLNILIKHDLLSSYFLLQMKPLVEMESKTRKKVIKRHKINSTGIIWQFSKNGIISSWESVAKNLSFQINSLIKGIRYVSSKVIFVLIFKLITFTFLLKHTQP